MVHARVVITVTEASSCPGLLTPQHMHVRFECPCQSCCMPQQSTLHLYPLYLAHHAQQDAPMSQSINIMFSCRRYLRCSCPNFSCLSSRPLTAEKMAMLEPHCRQMPACLVTMSKDSCLAPMPAMPLCHLTSQGLLSPSPLASPDSVHWAATRINCPGLLDKGPEYCSICADLACSRNQILICTGKDL